MSDLTFIDSELPLPGLTHLLGYVRGCSFMRSTFWRSLMGLLFVLVTYLVSGVMPYVSLWSLAKLIPTIFMLRPIIVWIEVNVYVSCVILLRLRWRLTLFFIALSFMRSKGDFIVYIGTSLLFQPFSAIVSNSV